MKRALLALLLLASPASANSFCAQLDGLFKEASTISLPSRPDAETTCSTALALSGETSKHCAWPFDYRSEAATQAFEALVTAVPACLELDVAAADDQDVNHPDFYDLRVFNPAQGEVGISLKDKGALQQTYVFLRVTPGN